MWTSRCPWTTPTTWPCHSFPPRFRSQKAPTELRSENFEHFSDAMLTLFQCFTLDSAGEVYRPLISHNPVLPHALKAFGEAFKEAIRGLGSPIS